MAGIGAAIGEFTRGYATGLKLSSDLDDAQKKRDLYQAEIDTRNEALRKSKQIDEAKVELANSMKEFFPLPDGSDPVAAKAGINNPEKSSQIAADSSLKYRNAMFKYLSIASPDKLDEFRRTMKSEDMQLAALDAARVTAGLMTQDKRALEQAAKMNGVLAPGMTLDLKRSGYEKDGSVRFAINDADGKALPDNVMSKEQIHYMGYRFLNDPNAMMQHAQTFAHQRETERLQRDQLAQTTKHQDATLAEMIRSHNLDYSARMAGIGAQNRATGEAAASRQELARERAMTTHITNVGSTYGDIEKSILQSPEFIGDPKRQKEALTEVRRVRGAAMDAIQLNMSMGRPINYAEVMDPGRMSEILSGRGVAPLYEKIKQKDGTVVDGARIPGLGITSGGLIVRYQDKSQK